MFSFSWILADDICIFYLASTTHRVLQILQPLGCPSIALSVIFQAMPKARSSISFRVLIAFSEIENFRLADESSEFILQPEGINAIYPINAVFEFIPTFPFLKK